MAHLLKAVARRLGLTVSPLPDAPDLGVREGRLLPCPSVRTCAASYGEGGLPPLEGAGGGEATMQRLRRLLAEEPRAQVVEEEAGYLRAAFTVPPLGFTDDVEFLWSEEEGVVHFRSASRIGSWDLGVNRRRMRRLARRWRRMR